MLHDEDEIGDSFQARNTIEMVMVIHSRAIHFCHHCSPAIYVMTSQQSGSRPRSVSAYPASLAARQMALALAQPCAPLKIYDLKRTDRKLGSGAFGTVYEVEWNGTACAAKFMHDIFKEILSEEEKQAFITAFEKECSTWAALRHPQIVQFLGIYYDPSRTPVMVLEKMDASLRLMLETTPKEEFSLINKVVILRQTAQGLVYLHSHSPKLVHHDLSPNNILVNEVTYVTKLTDFGMTRAIDAATLTRSSSIKGTPGFMPPEALRYPPQYNDKLDVFSYGNVIISIITHKWPTPTAPQSGEGEATIENPSEFQLREHHFEQFSKEEMKAFGKATRLCLEDEAVKRPTSKMLLSEMKHIEAAVLEGGIAADTEASNIQLAMWRMQNAVQKKEADIAKMNEENQSMQSNISRLSENARFLNQHLDRLRLESQMEESPILDLSTSGYFSTEHSDSSTGPASTGVVEEERASSGRWQFCCRQGKCACCLITVSIL